MDTKINIEYEVETNKAEVYYRGTLICEVSFPDVVVQTIKAQMSNRDMFLDRKQKKDK